MLDKLKIYHAMPYLLRVVIANARGYHLNWWRYGKHTDGLIAASKERETWSCAQWRVWQEEKLAFVLEHAAKNVPYYQEHWTARRRNGDKASLAYLENWPVLKKEQVRQNPERLLADGCNPKRMFRDNTSGSTGTPLYVYLARRTVQEMYALFEARVREWHGVSRKDRWAIMGGQLVAPFDQDHPPYWVFNAGLNQLYMSTHHLSSKTAETYVNKLIEYKPSHMLVYPSSAAVLANAILEFKLKSPETIKAVISNAEPLTGFQRATIQQAFGCPVINTYGMGEGVTGASECAAGQMHYWPEVGYIEVLGDNDDKPAGNASGRFVITSLLNKNMPLIRYDVGDRGRLNFEKQCACGRGLPIIEAIEGRSNDLIITRDGRRIFWINPAFYNLPLREAQIIQETLDSILVRVVPASGFSDETESTIQSRLADRLGNMQIRMDVVEHIPRTKAGKFQAVISNIKTNS